MRDGAAVNLVTFDVEGFVEASQDIIDIPSARRSPKAEREEIELNTLAILDLLAELGQRATFFVLGRIGRDMTRLVRRIAEAGHEIACHSFEHRRLHRLAPSAVRAALGDAKRYLEDAGGCAVGGFRAPDFSITEQNLWVLDLLREAGFTYDSSVYPTGLHDVYGIRGFPAGPVRLANGLIEVPLSALRVLGWGIPFGGGGYLRLYPLAITRWLYRAHNRQGCAGVLYLHPYEMGRVIPRIDKLSMARTFRTYVGVKGAARKLAALIRDQHFVAIDEYLARYPVGKLRGGPCASPALLPGARRGEAGASERPPLAEPIAHGPRMIPSRAGGALIGAGGVPAR
jgi:polysaccharide deacetylase family protein (PEP-CTERM system associated)